MGGDECLQCESGYILEDGRCALQYVDVDCPAEDWAANCDGCQSTIFSQLCSVCSQSHYLTPLENYFRSCLRCPDDKCIACTGPSGDCEACQAGYKVESAVCVVDYTPIPCPGEGFWDYGCSECQSSLIYGKDCAGCADGYHLVEGVARCEEDRGCDVPGCAECGEDGCLRCEWGGQLIDGGCLFERSCEESEMKTANGCV